MGLKYHDGVALHLWTEIPTGTEEEGALTLWSKGGEDGDLEVQDTKTRTTFTIYRG